jgi:uncharacterized protein
MSRRRSGEALAFTGAALVSLVHALDDAFWHRGDGLGLSQHALAGTLATAGVVASIALFPRLRPGLRAALAFFFGALALVNGTMHVVHIAGHGAAGGDITGALAAAAGATLLGLAASIPWRHRGERNADRPRRRWANRGLAVAGAVVAMVVLVVPMSMSIIDTHKWRDGIGAPPSPAYQNVTFDASDGLELAGWYRPSRNGAAVIVVHGGGSDREGSVAHARMLARHGYGVLLYDARGRGDSEGSPNGYGWDWAKDVEGALDFLVRRDDVDPDRIGALGLSTGADILIEAAARHREIGALVADGAAAESFEDWHRLKGAGPVLPSGWVMFTTTRVLAGDPPGPPLEDQIGKLKSPTLLISSGEDVERDFNVMYDEVGNPEVEHFNLPDAVHTHGIHDAPRQYERRVVDFFGDALL